jgi:drug/metabolite transporter (DMT)-like permease
MLLGTILLWALNVTVTRYVVTHGFKPLAYATIRYFAATVLFWGFTWQRERSFRIARADLRLVGVGGLLIFLNQLCFVISVHETSASTVALILGALPIFTGLIASLFGIERLSGGFWIAAAVAFVGVGFVAAGSGGFSSNVRGDALAVGTTVSWAGYSVVIAPLMRRYSPYRISAVVLSVMVVPFLGISALQIQAQDYGSLNTLTWFCLAYAIVGPLFLTNILWFTAVHRVGAAHATLFANIQPFVAAVFAYLILSEHLHWLQVLGGVTILAGILLERRWRQPRSP